MSPKLLKERKEQVAELRLQPPVSACVLSHFSLVQLFVTLWTIACQTLLSMGFFKQQYWNGLQFLPPGDLPDPAIKPTSPVSPALQVDSLPLESLGPLSDL